MRTTEFDSRTTARTSVLGVLLGAILTTTTLACGNGSAGNAAPLVDAAAPTDKGADASVSDAGSTGRTLIDNTDERANAGTNLLLDPGFTLGTDSPSFGGFLALYERAGSVFSIGSEIDGRSPAGISGAVAKITAEGATDAKSQAVILVAPFLGGSGPLDVRVWASKTDVAGNAVADVPVGKDGVSATLTDDPNNTSTAVDLAVTTTVIRGARTWVLLEAHAEGAFPRGGFLFIRTGTTGGGYLLAAPSIIAAPLVDGEATTRALTFSARRVMTDAERRAVVRYKAIPPRLVPAPTRASALDLRSPTPF